MSYSSELYMHDLDRKAFDALSSFSGLVKLREAYIAEFDEKTAKINFLSSAVRLNERQLPDIYNLLPPICDKLDIMVPELYYMKEKVPNAATGGSKAPYVYVTSGLVEKFPPDLIGSVLAHECGHIACKHYLYHSIAQMLIEGVDRSVLRQIPTVRRYLTPALVRALLFWDRCSELSADRAAVLCDGSADKTIDMLLKIHGYGDNIDRKEFIKQALDLRAFINDSKSNKILEQMLVQEESHPRIATRVSECYEFEHSNQFRGIIDGTYTEEKQREEQGKTEEEEVIQADVTVNTAGSDDRESDIDRELERVNSQLKRYTSQADQDDYAFAVFSGILAGIIDAVYVGEISINENDITLSHQNVNNFIQQYAKEKGIKSERLKDAIAGLEKKYRVAQDNSWKDAHIKVTAKKHHLADLAHHPTPLGLVSAIMVQFLRIGTFVNKDGEWHFVFVKTDLSELKRIFAPVIITGILNWLVTAGESEFEKNEQEIPKAVQRISRLVATAPILVEVAKCADNWFGHLVSDMGGSKNTAGGGMGISGIFISMLYEVSALPGFKDSGLPLCVNNLYANQKIDLRHEMLLYKAAGRQMIPVVFNELLVRTGYFVTRFAEQVNEHKGIKDIDWNLVFPFGNRTIDRMLTVAGMTFTVADTADAAVHAALESAGNWVCFSGKFVTRFNYIGAGRAAFSVVKEIVSEKKESQLLHEKMILMEAKTAFVIEDLEKYKAQLEELLSNYLAEDIEEFMDGFGYIQKGLAVGDSNMVIKGNVVIQKVLGREPQFKNQEEFDEIMESDIPLIL